MGKKNICCNAIALGVIDTEMTQVLPSELLDVYRDATFLKRFGKCSDVANLVEFLVSPAADYITGQVISLDGGMV